MSDLVSAMRRCRSLPVAVQAAMNSETLKRVEGRPALSALVRLARRLSASFGQEAFCDHESSQG